jgi:hypothetical protein
MQQTKRKTARFERKESVKAQPIAEPKASGQETELVAPSALPLAVVECSSREGSVCALLRPNSAKVDPMQPALLGSAKFGELSVGLSLWWQATRDGARDYYSMTVQDTVKAREAWQNKEKIEPLARLKLYQFRQKSLDDPDFAASEPLVYEGKDYWALLWVGVPPDFPEEANEQDLKRIAYALVFSLWRPAEKWEKNLREYALTAADYLRARRKELEALKWAQTRKVELKADIEDDEIPS